MPKATAVWLVENTSLSFEQIADFCKLHPLEVKGIADGEVAAGIKGIDPVANGQLTREEIERAQTNPSHRLKVAESKVKLPEVKRDQEGAALHAGVAPPGPAERHPLAPAQPPGAEGRADHAARRHDQDDDPADPRAHALELEHACTPIDPVTLGLCSQIDLDFEVQRAAKDQPQPARPTIRAARPCCRPRSRPRRRAGAGAFRRSRAAASPRPRRRRSTSNSVFAKLKQLKRPGERGARRRPNLGRQAPPLQRRRDLVEDGRVVDGRRHRPGLAVGDLLHGAAQDLAGAGLRQPADRDARA